MGRSKNRVVTSVVALVAVLALGAVAIAQSGGPQTDEVQATLDFKHFKGKFRECPGQDGLYGESEITVVGTSEGDPRLTGDFEAKFRYLDLVDGPEALIGTVDGKLVVRDPATGKKKVDAKFNAVDKDDETIGFLVGQAKDKGSGPEPTAGAGDLFANFRFEFVEAEGPNGEPGFDVVGKIGGTSDSPQRPAVIQSGKCSGPFERDESELPRFFPEEGASASRASAAPRGWSRLAR